MNEDIASRGHSVRSQLLQEFLSDFNLDTVQTEKTYTDPDGSLVSTHDYIFYPKDFTNSIKRSKKFREPSCQCFRSYPCALSSTVST